MDGKNQHTHEQTVRRLAADHPEVLDYDQLYQASDGLRLPVFMPGLCAEAVATKTWTLDGLLALEPETPVTVEYYADADRRKRYELVTKPFGDLAGVMVEEPEKWFIAEQNLDQVFPKVAADLPPLPVLPGDARSVLRLVFFGTNSQSATHFHVRDQAILSHLRGQKRVILTGPKTTDRMATNSPFGGRPQFSTHGPEAGGDALECFAELVGEDEVSHVDLLPGDALFIPVHWWHWAEGKGENLSVTTFWRASLREWVFPHPGIRAVAALGLGESAKAVRQVVGRLNEATASRSSATSPK